MIVCRGRLARLRVGGWASVVKFAVAAATVAVVAIMTGSVGMVAAVGSVLWKLR